MKTYILSLSIFIFIHFLGSPLSHAVEEPSETFTLKHAVETALKANISLKISKEEANAALAVEKKQKTKFFPTFNATYQYEYIDEEATMGTIVAGSQEEYTLISKVTQPVFTGFSLLNQYKIAKLGLDAAKINEKLKRLEIIFEAKKMFFSLLKAQKFLKISQDTVTQITAQKEVAKNFYEVGMTPLNDLLQAKVELANARQELISAQNNLEITKSNFNVLLRRPINESVELEDVLSYTTFGHDIDYCFKMANKNRLELKIADLEIEIAEKEVKLAQKDYYPSINLEGSYFKRGTEWDVDGGDYIYDPEGWSITAVASWDFWEWGRSIYEVKEKQSRLSQAQYQKTEILDNIRIEVKQAYLNTLESEKNITTVKKAIEQAKENFRINKERYKEQIATSTDVLDAQTLLSRTMTNYYKALYDFKIAKASIYKAIGQEVME
ncbi:MAG: TolC family protein [Desulfobacterales bacterium]|jgi:outer membrane protein TolC|nr:TolC family protein [Desulfobacterales bacterium]